MLVAPPPGSNFGSCTTFLRTCIASWIFLLTSFNTPLDPPQGRMVHAFGSLHSLRKVKYSLPNVRTSKKPHKPHSIFKSVFQSSSFGISILILPLPFLYYYQQSTRRMWGFSILCCIIELVTSLLKMAPFNTRDSLNFTTRNQNLIDLYKPLYQPRHWCF